MSVETLRAIEDAIAAHHRDLCDPDKPERAGAIVTSWVIGYEIANIVNVGEAQGGNVMGYANDYIMSDSSPNTLAHLAQWVAGEIDANINGAGDEDE